MDIHVSIIIEVNKIYIISQTSIFFSLFAYKANLYSDLVLQIIVNDLCTHLT